MTIYLSHISALEYWAYSQAGSTLLAARRRGMRNPSWRTRARLPENCTVTAAELQEFANRADAPLTFPIHTLVCRPEARTRWKGAICHANSKPLPRGSFIKVDKGVFVSSPELCFVLMARYLSLIMLVKLGCELCGTYGIPTIGHIDYDLEHPYTTRERLERFLEQADSLPGIDKARKAFTHLVFGSASPMETKLALLLCLPLHRGGYGLPKPQMNPHVNPKQRKRFISNGTCYYCDLLWPEAAIALEYDSFEFHGTRTAQANDAKRRTELLGRDIVAVSVTGRTVQNLLELDKVAHTLAKRLGVRIRNTSTSWRGAQHKLQGMLLADDNGKWSNNI